MKSVEQMVKHYQEMQAHGTMATASMIREVKQQYINMARGGDGGQLQGFDQGTTCRTHNYSNYPDSFFREVCERMGWLQRGTESLNLEPYSSDPF